MKGRKPKPSYMRVLDGNAGKRPPNPDEPVPAEKLEEVPAPSWMTEEQQTSYRFALKSAPAGMLRSLDRSVLAVWAVAEATHAKASREVSRIGELVKGANGPYQNPWLAIMNKQALIMLKACAEMGFTPSSRSRVKIEKRKPGEGDAFADLKSLTDD